MRCSRNPTLSAADEGADHLVSGSLAADYGPGTTDYCFTGQRVEAGLGLLDYCARFYDPALGRFISADTLVPNPGNPQDLNRYAYVRNNPLRYTDPSGHRVDPFGVGARDEDELPPTPAIIPVPVPTPPSVTPTGTPTPAPTVRPESTAIATTPGWTSTPIPLVVAGPDGPVQVGVWTPLPPSEPAEGAVGWRLDVSLQALGGIDFNADLMLNLGSGELDLLLGPGLTGGPNAGGSWTTGPVIAWNCPTNEALEGVDLLYKGGDIPVAFLGLNVEVEMATSLEGSGPTTLYLGVSPLGMPGGIQAGAQTGISVNVLRVRLLDLW
ncbi:MAG: RHS repeat-associated core domain-containing protein [Anaerolineae bacterium]|nr:RHS repeat-associated core domain-containing protein [Anaerolineae bacterium]